MFILFHFKLILLKLEYVLITTDLLNQNWIKKVMSLYKNCFNQVLQMDIFPELLNTVITNKIILI